MNEYTASNGIGVRHDGRDLDIKNTLGWVGICGGVVVDALREYFIAKEDERLGRFRHGEYVVYPDWRDGDATRRVFTIWEKNGRRDVVSEDEIPNTVFGAAARAYFDAHPDPKPWHDAKPGEVWALVYLNEEVPAVASSSESGHFIFTASTNQGGGTEEFRTDSKHITAGRRIWPES